MAKLLKLEGKYYGSVIELLDESKIIVWVNDNNWSTPSPRQIEMWGMTLEEAKENDMMCDSHFESARGYKITSAIADMLTEIGE